MTKTTIIGAGLAGLSCSYHLGHKNCILFEKKSYAGGHIYSHQRDGFTWDEGPHVSFTKHDYVRDLFAQSIEDNFLEFECIVSNWYRGNWIPHPAQSNLFAIPEPKRTACLNDFLKSRQLENHTRPPETYAEWLQQAFGSTFAKTFPRAYTRKYWTCDPVNLATDWVGHRVFYPDIKTVLDGYKKSASKSTHYITTVRYPSQGGYIGFAKKLIVGANISFKHEVAHIDLQERIITFGNGKKHSYERLISTMPLPLLIKLANNVPAEIREAAELLRCSSLLLVNVTASHVPRQHYHWLYVYDEDKYSTRISHIDLLSPSNAPLSQTGIQVEVYESPYRPFQDSHEAIANSVVIELQDMGLIHKPTSVHTQFIPFANVIFDHSRRSAQDAILGWLEQFGLCREEDDLEPTTSWANLNPPKIGSLGLAGRFGQWKYFWTDDCILRGYHLSHAH